MEAPPAARRNERLAEKQRELYSHLRPSDASAPRGPARQLPFSDRAHSAMAGAAWLAAAAALPYLVFYHDFGEQENLFSKPRDWAYKTFPRFLNLPAPPEGGWKRNDILVDRGTPGEIAERKAKYLKRLEGVARQEKKRPPVIENSPEAKKI